MALQTLLHLLTGRLSGLCAALLCCLLLSSGKVVADAHVAVVYPDLGEPYRSIFISIISGIEAELQDPPVLVPVPKGLTDTALAQRLRTEKVTAVIALGRSSVQLLSGLDLALPRVQGAIIEYEQFPEKDAIGISLTPDPERMFEELRRISPDTRSVTVIYSQDRIEGLIQRASRAASRLNLTFTAHKTQDLMDAATTYRTVTTSLGRKDALWIVQDPQAVDEKVILPMLLNAAWENGFVLFSSYAEHAKRGALFSVYPDNFGMGRRLAQLAVQAAQGGSAQQGIVPLHDLFVAVNLRAAEHIGVPIGADLLQTFDLTFPQR